MATPNYWDYLRLKDLLALQGGFGADDESISSDELHFIVVHQSFELWFKLCLRELRLARDHMMADDVPEEQVSYVVDHLRRVLIIFQQCAAQFSIMETLTTQDFLAFRDRLIPASGFQSYQMRELELVLGLTEEQRAATPAGLGKPLDAIRKLGERSPDGAVAVQHLARAEREPTFRAAMHRWLHRTPIHGSTPDDPDDDAVVRRFVDDYLAIARQRAEATAARLVDVAVVAPDEAKARTEAALAANRSFLHAEGEADPARVRRLRAAILFIESYRRLPLLAWPRTLLDTVIELEQAMLTFRFRHARMVERVIGRRIGTGGSSGVDYLDATLSYRIFPELWAVRSVLLPRDALPPVDEAAYGFAR